MDTPILTADAQDHEVRTWPGRSGECMSTQRTPLINPFAGRRPGRIVIFSSIAAFVAFAAAISPAIAKPAAAASSFPSGYQQLTVDNDGLCLDVFGASTSDDAAIDQWGCKTSGQSNQEFQFNPVSGGYGELQNQNSGLDINVDGASTASMAPVIQYDQDGSANSLWLPIQLSDGSWQFQNQNSGLCLDVTGATSTPGTQLEQYACKSSAAGTNQGFATS
jgi:chitinase